MCIAGALCLSCVGYAADTATAGPDQSVTYKGLTERGARERAADHFSAAAVSFQAAARLAQTHNNQHDLARALFNLSGCQIREFCYSQALRSADTALSIADSIHDDDLVGAAANNRATIYTQVGDHAHAAAAAEEATRRLEHSHRRAFLASALTNYGDILEEMHRSGDSTAAYRRAMAVAHAAGLGSLEAIAEDHLGESLAGTHNFAAASQALEHARSLFKAQNDSGYIALTSFSLAQLAFEEGNYPQAQHELDFVIAQGRHGIGTLPPYVLHHFLGQILLASGSRTQAMEEYSRALLLARKWRRDVLPGDATSTHTVVWLNEVYEDYVELAAQDALRLHSTYLSRSAFNAMTENRASGLREQMIRVVNSEMQLPPRYFELLTTLQTEQAHATLSQTPAKQKAEQNRLDAIRTELSDIENRAFAGHQQFTAQAVATNALTRIQARLGPDQLLLSYSLGSPSSFVWAVTSHSMRLYELPKQAQLAAEAEAFSKAVQKHTLRSEGTVLSAHLFGLLPANFLEKRDWLVVEDGSMLADVPLAPLPNPQQPGKLLIADHTLRSLPSALLLASTRSPEPATRFVGVGDPIYNTADARRSQQFSILPVAYAQDAISLGRLVGSARELNDGARASGLQPVLLTGADASAKRLRETLATTPRILHFAVHVVSPQGQGERADQAAIALTLDNQGVPELLTKETIATLRVPGTLVVLSGCASQQGKALPGAGLIGLSRAWLLAGASAVLVSAWPTPDDSGRFFTAFYKHLSSAAPGNMAEQAANALRQTQLDMQQNTGYRSLPSYWAAYSVVSKE